MCLEHDILCSAHRTGDCASLNDQYSCKLMYLNSESLAGGAVWERNGTIRMWTLAGGSASA